MTAGLYRGRKKPYTVIGIGRCKCSRCGRPALHQFNVCANANWYMPVCLECDILLNDLVLRFMRHPNRRALMRHYIIKARKPNER